MLRQYGLLVRTPASTSCPFSLFTCYTACSAAAAASVVLLTVLNELLLLDLRALDACSPSQPGRLTLEHRVVEGLPTLLKRHAQPAVDGLKLAPAGVTDALPGRNALLVTRLAAPGSRWQMVLVFVLGRNGKR
jgi:hypothetical protein